MKNKLKAYRKSNGLSKKEMAKKLDIKTKEYKEIENGEDINNDVIGKINALLKGKASNKKAEIKLPTGIPDFTKAFDRANSLTNSHVGINMTINSSIGKASSLFNLTKAYKPEPIGFDLLKTITNQNYIGLDTLTNNSMFSNQVKVTIDNQSKFLDSYNFIFDNQGYNDNIKSAINSHKAVLASIKNVTDPVSEIMKSSAFKSITEIVVNNKTSYQNFIDFSSDLSKIISNSAISNDLYSNLISTSSFLNQNKEPSIVDILSGSTFMLFDKDNDFGNEKEIIEQINNDEQLKQEANNFIKELNQIINDDTDSIEIEKVESIYSKFANWISHVFNKTEVDAKKIAKILIKVLLFLLPFAYSNYQSDINRIAHEKTQEESKEMKKILIDLYNNSEKTINTNQEILDKLNSESSQNMVALEDVNLRTRRSLDGKTKAIVLASQRVIVLDKKTKWMEIIYVDMNDNLPKTGWVKIEYFNSILLTKNTHQKIIY